MGCYHIMNRDLISMFTGSWGIFSSYTPDLFLTENALCKIYGFEAICYTNCFYCISHCLNSVLSIDKVC